MSPSFEWDTLYVYRYVKQICHPYECRLYPPLHSSLDVPPITRSRLIRTNFSSSLLRIPFLCIDSYSPYKTWNLCSFLFHHSFTKLTLTSLSSSRSLSSRSSCPLVGRYLASVSAANVTMRQKMSTTTCRTVIWNTVQHYEHIFVNFTLYENKNFM